MFIKNISTCSSKLANKLRIMMDIIRLFCHPPTHTHTHTRVVSNHTCKLMLTIRSGNNSFAPFNLIRHTLQVQPVYAKLLTLRMIVFVWCNQGATA